MASSAPRLGPFLLEPTLATNEELTHGRERTRGADLWSADLKRWPNRLKLGMDAARWAPMSYPGVWAPLKVVWMLWWARGSS